MKTIDVPRVTVVDALMGAGKTSWAIRMLSGINKGGGMFQDETEGATVQPDDRRRFIYVTPFLSEVEAVRLRLHSEAATLAVDPDTEEGQSKLSTMTLQAYDGENIVSTHALFSLVDDRAAAAFRQYRYTLVIDEVADWVQEIPVSAMDFAVLIKAGVISIEEETQRVIWHEREATTLGELCLGAAYRGKHEQLRRMCRLGRVYLAEAEGKEGMVFLVYQFPIAFLENFEEVYVLTHMFDGSLMAAFLRMHGVAVDKMTLSEDKRQLVPFDPHIEAKRVSEKARLIRLVADASMNDIGAVYGRSRRLSKSWYDSDANSGRKSATKLRNTLYGWLRHTLNKSVREIMWATYEPHAQAVASKLATFIPPKERRGRHYDDAGVLKHSFVPWNARASNHWRTRDAVAYLVNLHHRTYLASWFKSKGVELSDDYYALLTMVQWVFRSAIRDDQPIDLWIPSERMRSLFTDWLKGKVPEGAKFATKPVADLEKTGIETVS